MNYNIIIQSLVKHDNIVNGNENSPRLISLQNPKNYLGFCNDLDDSPLNTVVMTDNSRLALNSGYNQLQVYEADISPLWYRSLTGHILNELVYIDDIYVFTNDQASHDKTIEYGIQQLNNTKLNFNLKRCCCHQSGMCPVGSTRKPQLFEKFDPVSSYRDLN